MLPARDCYALQTSFFLARRSAITFSKVKSNGWPTLGGARMGELVNGFGRLGSAKRLALNRLTRSHRGFGAVSVNPEARLIRQILGGQGASHLRLEALEALEAYPTIELSLAGWEAYPTVEHWIALADSEKCLKSSLF